MGGNALKLFVAPDLDELFQKLRAKAASLPLIANDNSKLRLFAAVLLAHAAYAENFMRVLVNLIINHQRQLAIVIVETDAREPFVRDALAQIQRAKVPVAHAPLGERFVEFHHQGLVFRTNRADDDRRAVLQLPGRHVLRGIGADRKPRQADFRRLRVVEDNARVQRDDLLG